MDYSLTPQQKHAIIAEAEQWASRLYRASMKGFLNTELSDFRSGRYVIDLELEGIERWISIEIQLKHGKIVIPGGAQISGRSSLADVHRRFS